VEADLRGGDGGAGEVRESALRARRHLDAGTDLVLRDLADLWRKGEEEVFASEGAAIGQRWPPLADSTRKARARLIAKFGLQITPASPVLVNYSDLRDSFRHKGGPQHQRVDRTTVRIEIDQGAINRHNRKKGLGMALTKDGQHRRKPRGKGGRYPENIIDIHEKRRPMIGVPAAIEAEMDRRVERFLGETIDRLVRQAGG
jgi:hypothetical protein